MTARIINNALSYTRGESVVLDNSNINVADVDDTAAEMNLTVSGVTGGQFERVSNPGVAITSFTQQDINSGNVRFVHDGVTVAAYSLTVVDEVLSDGPLTATITELAPAPAPVEEDTELLVLTGVINDLNEIKVTEVELTTSEKQDATVKIKVENNDAETATAPESVSEVAVQAVTAPLQANLQLVSDNTPEPQPNSNTVPQQEANRLQLLNSFDMKTLKLGDNMFMKLKTFDSRGIDTIEADDEDGRRNISERNFEAAIQKLREQLGETTEADLSKTDQVVAAAKGLGMALSVGSVSWLLRVEWLFSFLVSSIPAWQRFDPLPVLTSQRTQAKPVSSKASDEEKAEALRDDNIEEQAARILGGSQR